MKNLIEPKSIEEGNLLYYLKENLGEENLSYDEVNRTYKINYSALIKKFPFNNLITTFKNNDLTVESLLQYLNIALEYNNTSSKTSTFPIIIPLINATYGVTYISKIVTIGNYNYEIYYKYNLTYVDETIKDIIELKKLSYEVCDFIRVNVNNLFPELITYVEVDFKDETKKKYDLGIALNNNSEEKQFLIVVEIQEKTKIHDKNPNDKNKQYNIESKGLIIKYFFEDQMTDTDYEANFYANLMHTCYEVLIVSSENFRNKNLLNEVKILSKKKIKELENELSNIDENSLQYELKKININEYLQLSEDEDSSIKQIKKLYQYKINAYNSGIEYNIPLKLIVENLDLDINIKNIGNKNKNEKNQFIDIYILQYTTIINGKYYFSYESAFKFLKKLNLAHIENLINHNINILFFTQEIYDNYINIIIKYKDSIIDKLKEYNYNIKKIIRDNIENQYKLILTRNKQKIEVLESQVKELHKEHNITPKKINQIQFINDKPIIDEDYCALYYSNDHENRVSSQDALIALLNYGISITDSKDILKKIYYKNNHKIYTLTFDNKNEQISNLYFNNKLN